MLAGCEPKMIVRLLVLLFHEQRPRQLKPDAQQSGIAIQDLAKQDFRSAIVLGRVAGHPVEERSFGRWVEFANLTDRLRLQRRRTCSAAERRGEQQSM